tara:strand:- start:1059 stop:1289 length:231 start_codon:yes stop_codon:yes gene_type:complete
MTKYIIINTSELSGLNFDQLKQNSENTVRKNLANNKAIVSYEGTVPDGLSEKTEYTNEELLVIINDINNGWYQEEE